MASGDQVVSHVRMTAIHAGPFVMFPPGGKPQVVPATGRRFSARQFHLFRVSRSHCVIGVRPGTRASPQASPASRARSMA